MCFAKREFFYGKEVLFVVLDGLFDQTAILHTAVNALAIRNEVYQNNIANAETPYFKKSEVYFEAELRKALDDAKRTGELDLSGVSPRIYKYHPNYSYRIDENNVDIELEMAALYQNQMKFEALEAGVVNYYKRINSVLSMRM